MLAQLQQEGLIKHLGVSTVNAEQIAEAQSIAPIVCVQNFYNIANRDDDDLIDSLAAQGIAYVPYFPLGGFSPLQSEDAGVGRHPSRRHTDGRRTGVAAAALTEHPAHPRHLIRRAPARERRRCCADPFRGRSERAEQHYLMSTTNSQPAVGFIGPGEQGLPMAIAAAGYPGLCGSAIPAPLPHLPRRRRTGERLRASVVEVLEIS